MENLKSDILNTAATLFKKCGLRSVSIDDVCKELHISKKTFYNYFKQKEELIEKVLHNFHEQNKAKHSWHNEYEKNSIDLLMEFDKKIKFNTEENEKNISMLFDLEKYYPKIYQQHLDMMREIQYEAMKKFIQRGLDEGIFRQDLDIDMTALFIASQFGSFRTFIREKNKKRKDLLQMFYFFRDMMIRILTNEKGMDYYLRNYYNRQKQF